MEDHCLIQKHGSYVLFSFFPRLREGRECGKLVLALHSCQRMAAGLLSELK